MTKIFALILKEQGLTCSKRFLEKAYDLFAETVTHACFGNGRLCPQSARTEHYKINSQKYLPPSPTSPPTLTF